MRRFLLIIVTLAGAVGLCGCDDSEELVRVASERDANEILVRLGERHVTGLHKLAMTEQRKTTWSIRGPRSAMDEGRRILTCLRLPRQRAVGLEGVAASGSLIPTANEERARLMHALSGEIRNMLEKISGVLEADVVVVLPEKQLLMEPKAAPAAASASVVITYLAREVKPDPASAPSAPGAGAATADPPRPALRDDAETPANAPVSSAMVRQMLAKSVEGLKPDNVTVVFSAVPEIRPEERPESPEAASIVQWLYWALVGVSVLCLILLLCLVVEKRRKRAGGVGAMGAMPRPA